MSSVLAIIPYTYLFPPRNGGQLRCFYLLRELAREHQVHAIILQPEAELRHPQNGYQFPESVHVYGPVQTPPPKTIFSRLPRKLGTALHYRWLQKSPSGPASSIVLQTHHLIRQVLTMQEIDTVLFEDLAAASAAPLVRQYSPKSVRILDTVNVDHVLMQQQIHMYVGDARPPKALVKAYARARWQESHLDYFVDAFFACSEHDREKLASLNPRVHGFTVPNGMDIQARPFDDRKEKSNFKTMIFSGSLDYLPNREGLEWFHTNIWPLILNDCPAARLLVVGRGAHSEDYVNLRADPAVEFIGAVDDVVPYYRRAGVAVVPVRKASGTRLKILEAMSLGNPVVSTSIGAQGIKAANGEHIRLEDEPERFASAIVELMHNPGLFEKQRHCARTMVEQYYDWQVIGRHMNKVIADLVERRA